VDAVAKGDPDGAEGAIRDHLAHVVQALRDQRPATVG
jgi:DNA-binding FadR family transcriptional regulator